MKRVLIECVRLRPLTFDQIVRAMQMASKHVGTRYSRRWHFHRTCARAIHVIKQFQRDYVRCERASAIACLLHKGD